jgi:aconitate hydratase
MSTTTFFRAISGTPNLANFGILPLIFLTSGGWNTIDQDDVCELEDVRETIRKSNRIDAFSKTKNRSYALQHVLSRRQVEMVLAGGLINVLHGQNR